MFDMRQKRYVGISRRVISSCRCFIHAAISLQNSPARRGFDALVADPVPELTGVADSGT